MQRYDRYFEGGVWKIRGPWSVGDVMASCKHINDADKIVDALNASKENATQDKPEEGN